MTILTMTNEHPDFYRLIGPFLARRSVVKAYGGFLWDDDGMRWAMALTPTGEVSGFAALAPQGLGVRVCNDYVLPTHRDEQYTIQAALLDTLLEQYPDASPVSVMSSEAERAWYEARGFSVRRRKGRYLEMTKTREGNHDQ